MNVINIGDARTPRALCDCRRSGQRAGEANISCNSVAHSPAGPAMTWSPWTNSAMYRWPKVGAEFLFQVVAERAEKAAVILTTWPSQYPSPN